MNSRNLEITVSSAQSLKNVNWRYGPLRSYAVLWVDGSHKCSTRKCWTRVDDNGNTSLVWNETVVIPLPPGPVEDQTLYINVVHVRSDSEEDTKPLIGSAKLKLRDVIDEAGYGERLLCSLHLKLPSGIPYGKLKVKVAVKEPTYRRADPYHAPPYGVQRQAPRRYPPPYRTAPPCITAQPYRTAPPCRTVPPCRIALPCRTAPPSRTAQCYRTSPPCRTAQCYRTAPPSRYAVPSTLQAPYGRPSYGQNQYAQARKPKSRRRMWLRLAVGAVAGALDGLALAENAVEDDIG